jgi:hypothetical protein
VRSVRVRARELQVIQVAQMDQVDHSVPPLAWQPHDGALDLARSANTSNPPQKQGVYASAIMRKKAASKKYLFSNSRFPHQSARKTHKSPHFQANHEN